MATVLPWWQPLKFPKRFVRLAFVAYKKGRLSKGKLAEMLDTSLIDLSKTPGNMTIKTETEYFCMVGFPLYCRSQAPDFWNKPSFLVIIQQLSDNVCDFTQNNRLHKKSTDSTSFRFIFIYMFTISGT